VKGCGEHGNDLLGSINWQALPIELVVSCS
jgi:hypothetical protein